MPLPMVHFVVAVELHKLEKRTPSPEFVLGSIAPDAIHARPNTDRSHKNRTHLLHKPHAQTADQEYRSLVHAFWLHQRERQENVDFMEGYVAHVLADRLWLNDIFYPFQTAVKHVPKEEVTRLYYREADQVDMWLHQRMGWRGELWQKLAQAAAVDVEDLVSAQEVIAWQQRTLHWYTNPQNNPQIEPAHITYAAVVDFAVSAARTIHAQLEEWQRVASLKSNLHLR